MGRVSVVIPTAARPETLEVTLRAVSRQVSRDLIHEVIVSENLGDRRSEELCRRFPELPIVYKLRDPMFTGGLGSFKNVATAFTEATGEFVALVCDDDVWSPGHVAKAVESLDANPKASAHFSAFYGAESEMSLECYQWGAPLLWLAAGRPARFAEYLYDEAAILALAWVFTPFQWSTLVARRDCAVAASELMLASPHAFFADRMLCLGLAQQGEIAFDPAVDTLYRIYEGNWVASQDPAYLRELSAQGEAMVEAEAAKVGVDLAALWRGYLKDMPTEMADEVNRWIVDRFSAEELDRYGFAPHLPRRKTTADKVLGRLRRAYGALAGKPL
jgi:glycosyltransferase involved in cell wall biosynthesis